jgi:hypothetical protein
MVDLEDLPDEDLERLQQEFQRLRQQSGNASGQKSSQKKK